MLNYLPFFRYEIFPCAINPVTLDVHAGSQNNNTHCWDHEKAKVTDTIIWQVFNFMIQVVLRIWPTVMICVLNIWMFLKLKRIQRQRNKTFGMNKKEETTTSTPDTIPSHASMYLSGKFRKIAHNNNTTKPLTTISEIVAKVNKYADLNL